MTTLCSVAALRDYAGPGEIVRVLGYHSPHDGGGGTFVWRLKHNLPAGTAADSGILLASANTTGAIARDKGLWERLNQDQVNVKWFGARGDGCTDDTLSIQAALNSGLPRIYLPYTSGGYRITGLMLPPGTSLIGLQGHGRHAAQKPILKVTAGKNHYAIKTNLVNRYRSLENIAVEGAPGIAFGLSVRAADFRTEDVSIYGFPDAPGMIIDRSRRSVHTRLRIYDCVRGLHFTGQPEVGSAAVFNSLQHTLRASRVAPSCLPAVKRSFWLPAPAHLGDPPVYPRRSARHGDDKIAFAKK